MNNFSTVNASIMIVDDEYFSRKLLRDILEKEGYRGVAEAVDGEEAVKYYKQFRPDITLMDIFMPVKNGIDATREIISIDGKARVLICCGVSFDDDVNAAMAAGAKDMIMKPVYPKEIKEIIDRIITG